MVAKVRSNAEWSKLETAAHDFITGLAETFESNDANRVMRFTPSVKIGRRYLVVISDGVVYSLTVETDFASEEDGNA